VLLYSIKNQIKSIDDIFFEAVFREGIFNHKVHIL